MSKYKRYGLLVAFGIVMFGVISIFQNKMFKLNIHTHLVHETHLNKSIYNALVLKHEGKKFDIEHILRIAHKITKAEYFLFDLRTKNLSLKIISDDILNEISKKLQIKHNLSYPVEVNHVWNVLTFIRCQSNPNMFVVSLNKSSTLQNIHDNRTKQLMILILVLSLLLVFFNQTLLYAQNIKIEKDKISLALQESKLYFENAMIGFLIVNDERKIINVNPHFCEMFGYEESELINQDAGFLHISQESYKRWGELIFAKAQKEALISIRYKMKKKDGTIFWIEVSGAPFDTKRESLFGGVVWTAKDITKQIEYERITKELNVTLSENIEQEVSKNIQQAEAFEREKLRDVKFSAIGQLAAGITHEINTPLTYVKGNLEMMKFDMQDITDTKLREQLIEDSGSLESGLNRIAKIVDSMREMSQQTKEAPERVNVYATLVTALILAYNRSKQICKIYLNSQEFSIDANKNEYICYSKLQEQRIEQVWIVIINNALDELQKIEQFHDRELHIDCSESGKYLLITFRDNAGGIDKDILKDIFEPFISTKTHGGMGVGLSITKKILEEQSATIRAYNKNNGAVFEVKLLKCELS